MPQSTIAKTIVAMIEFLSSVRIIFITLSEMNGGDNHVDQFDSDERNDNSAKTVDEQIALKNLGRAERAELYTPERERNQRDDDERVEDDGAQDRAGTAIAAS